MTYVVKVGDQYLSEHGILVSSQKEALRIDPSVKVYVPDGEIHGPQLPLRLVRLRPSA